jgi:hypothetical protein
MKMGLFFKGPEKKPEKKQEKEIKPEEIKGIKLEEADERKLEEVSERLDKEISKTFGEKILSGIKNIRSKLGSMAFLGLLGSIAHAEGLSISSRLQQFITENIRTEQLDNGITIAGFLVLLAGIGAFVCELYHRRKHGRLQRRLGDRITILILAGILAIFGGQVINTGARTVDKYLIPHAAAYSAEKYEKVTEKELKIKSKTTPEAITLKNLETQLEIQKRINAIELDLLNLEEQKLLTQERIEKYKKEIEAIGKGISTPEKILDRLGKLEKEVNKIKKEIQKRNPYKGVDIQIIPKKNENR